MEDMNLAWYYNWGTFPSVYPSVRDLDFTPMVWGDAAMENLRAGELDGYSTILGFNEPDLPGQADMKAADAATYWDELVKTGKRLGSPAMAYDFVWMDSFLAAVNNHVDFITVHIYYGPSAGAVENLISSLYQKYQKPIWITEFCAANFSGWNQDNVSPGGYTQQQAYNFMQEILPWLDAQPYVERYAWFSCDSAGAYGYSSLTDRNTGALTGLGQLYHDLCNPFGTEGFVPVKDVTFADTTVVAGTSLALTGQILPANATNKTITWSIRDVGTTGASVNGGMLYTTAAGTVTVTATISGGLSSGVSFTKDFTVEVLSPSAAHGWERTAIVAPLQDQLLPVGPVEIKWKNISAAGGDVPYYNVYVNSSLLAQVPQSDAEFLTFTWNFARAGGYTVSVQPVGTDLYAEVYIRVYSDTLTPPFLPDFWPEDGDLITLRSDYYNMYVRTGAIPDVDTMVADQPALTDGNRAQCTFEVVRRFGKIILKAYNQKIVIVMGWGDFKVMSSLQWIGAAGNEHKLFFIPQGDGTFKINHDIVYANVKPDGSLEGVFNAVPGDTAKFTWEKVGSIYTGVTVSGQVRSYNPGNSTILALKQDGKVLYTVTIEKDTGYGQVTQPFAFENVEPGDYTLVITKDAHTTYTVQKITVGTEPIDLTNSVGVMTLLCGDINGDNMINDSDLAELWRASNYNKSVNDPGVNKLCDLNGDGMINDSDLAILWAAVNYNKGAVMLP